MITWPGRAVGQTPDVTGRPDEPWWTRQAIAWLENYLKPDMAVLEWGTGASTPWLAARCGRLTSIDHNREFVKMATAALMEAGFNSEQYRVVLRPLSPDYYKSPSGKYDAAIIDGRLRVECCKRAMDILKPGGILLLDNAERKRYEKARSLLAGWPVIETNNGIWQTNIWTNPNAQ